MNQRVGQLDSLRGLAALTVVFHHFLLIFPPVADCTITGQCDDPLLRALTFSPLHVFWAGHEAVIFFFVLSELVLSLPFFSSPAGVGYASFAVKRVLRIYIPYLSAVLFAVACTAIFYRGGIPALSDWFNYVGQSPLDLTLVIQHVVFLGAFDNGRYDPVLWSLVHEMRISLFFPLIVYCVVRYPAKKVLAWALLLSTLSFAVLLGAARVHVDLGDYPATFHYVGMFAVGALLAKNMSRLVDVVRGWSRSRRLLCFTVAVLAYTYNWWGALLGPLAGSPLRWPVAIDWIVSLGVCGIIAWSVASNRARALLALRPIQFLGRISYSLYLYHAVILVVLLNALYGRMPMVFLLPLAFVLALAVSTVSYHFVERPSIAWGRYFSRKVSRSPATLPAPVPSSAEPQVP